MTQNQKESLASKDIGEVPIQVTPRAHLTIATLIAIVLFVISTTYGILHFFQISPLQEDLNKVNVVNTKLQAQVQGLSSKNDKLSVKLNASIEFIDKPLLVLPKERRHIVDRNVTFNWKYSKHYPKIGYVLEIRNITKSTKPQYFNVIRPEEQRFHLNFSEKDKGEYLWRIIPGRWINKKLYEQGKSSFTGSFTLHDSVIERILETGSITVVSTPTSYGNGFSSDGENYRGFDSDLVNWLAKKLTFKLGLKDTLNVEIIELPWKQLFTTLQRGEVDIAARSITITKGRERSYPNLKFSVGYIENHQIFITLRENLTFPDALNNSLST